MSQENVTVNNLLQSVVHAFFSGFVLGQTSILCGFMNSQTQSTFIRHDVVTVGKDTEKEFIDIDIKKLDIDKFYLVHYKNEVYAVRKISDDKIAFYDVV